jgi:hypothetical protein
VTFVDRISDSWFNDFFLAVAGRDSTGWTTPETIDHTSAIDPPYHAALSADGKRVAIAYGFLFLYQQGARTTYTWQKNNLSPFGAGFESSGKAWVVDYIADGLLGYKIPPRPGNAVLYEER